MNVSEYIQTLDRLLREQALGQEELDTIARAFAEVGLSAQMMSKLSRFGGHSEPANQGDDSMDASTLVSVPKPMFEFDVTQQRICRRCSTLSQNQSSGTQSFDGDHNSLDGDAGPSNQWANAHAAKKTEVDDSIIRKASEINRHGEDGLPSKFESVAELARGGVGVIHVVKDRELMRTLVAKTLIDGNEADEYVLKKFVEEAQITAQLEHPNIIPVHESLVGMSPVKSFLP